MLVGIFEIENGIYDWRNWLDEDDMKKAKYFVHDDNSVGVHMNIKSALYDDMTSYIDELQDEGDLADGELYVVCYFEFEKCSYGLLQRVDFGITKQEIIENIKNQKYVEGAYYYTIGQMFYTTREVMEGKYND